MDNEEKIRKDLEEIYKTGTFKEGYSQAEHPGITEEEVKREVESIKREQDIKDFYEKQKERDQEERAMLSRMSFEEREEYLRRKEFNDDIKRMSPTDQAIRNDSIRHNLEINKEYEQNMQERDSRLIEKNKAIDAARKRYNNLSFFQKLREKNPDKVLSTRMTVEEIDSFYQGKNR